MPRIGGGTAKEITDTVEEVALLCTLKNDYIVAYLGSGIACGHMVIVMEYIAGGSLSVIMDLFAAGEHDGSSKEAKQPPGKLAKSCVQRYTKDMLRGLSFLHQQSIVHRDLKPANVLLLVDGTCKLADFGTA